MNRIAHTASFHPGQAKRQNILSCYNPRRLSDLIHRTRNVIWRFVCKRVGSHLN